MNTKRRTAAHKKRAASWMRTYWRNLRENEPEKYEQIKAQRRRTWAAKRAQRMRAVPGRKAVNVNVGELGEPWKEAGA